MSKQWALLWSQSQNALHIETLDQMASANRKAYQDNRPTDFVPIYIGAREHIDAAAGFCHQTLAGREKTETEHDLRKPDLARAHALGEVQS